MFDGLFNSILKSAVKSELAGAVAVGLVGALYGYFTEKKAKDKSDSAIHYGLNSAGLGVLAALAANTYMERDFYNLGFAALGGVAVCAYKLFTNDAKALQRRQTDAERDVSKNDDPVISWSSVAYAFAQGAFVATAGYAGVQTYRG